MTMYNKRIISLSIDYWSYELFHWVDFSIKSHCLRVNPLRTITKLSTFFPWSIRKTEATAGEASIANPSELVSVYHYHHNYYFGISSCIMLLLLIVRIVSWTSNYVKQYKFAYVKYLHCRATNRMYVRIAKGAKFWNLDMHYMYNNYYYYRNTEDKNSHDIKWSVEGDITQNRKDNKLIKTLYKRERKYNCLEHILSQFEVGSWFMHMAIKQKMTHNRLRFSLMLKQGQFFYSPRLYI